MAAGIRDLVRRWLGAGAAPAGVPPAAAPTPEALKAAADGAADAGDEEGARRLYREAVTARPDYAEAWNNLGLSHHRAGALEEAEAAFRAATAARPALVPAWINLATVRELRGDLSEARACLDIALSHDPGSLPALHNLGTLLRSAGLPKQAEVLFRRLLAGDPGNAQARFSLALCLQAQARIGEAREALQALCEADPRSAQFRQAYLLNLNYEDGLDPGFIAAEHRRLGAIEVEALHPAPRAHAEGPLRVGYVSPDFGYHVVSMFLEPLLACHDRERFRIHCYDMRGVRDAQSERVRARADVWRNLAGLSDAAAREAVCADALDVAIDLAGHTTANGLALFARRIAPVQLTWLGYPNTTGVPAMDGRITDRWADPEGMTESLHTEQLIRLDAGFIAYRPPADLPAVTPPPSPRGGPIVFGSFNNLAKISPASLRLWAKVLARVPGARLLVKAKGLGDPGLASDFARRFADAGGDVSRLDLADWEADFRRHVARYSDVDVALDTFPYHGTTTTCEALAMGVPVVTLAGGTHVSRVGVSLLARLGHLEWVAATEDDYVALAAGLAADASMRVALRNGLRQTLATSALADAGRLVRELESVLETLVRERRARSLSASSGAPVPPPGCG